MEKITRSDIIRELNIIYCSFEKFPNKRKAIQAALESYKSQYDDYNCSKCNSSIMTEYSYCPYCGKKINKEE